MSWATWSSRVTAIAGVIMLAAGGGLMVAEAAYADDVAVENVNFSWSVNDESGSGAYFGGCNFLSAGIAGDAGTSRKWTADDEFYAAQDGNVFVTKSDDAGGQVGVSWDTKCQDASGAEVTPSTTTENQVTFTDGSGTLDPSANSASLTWGGGFTIVHYGGLTYWSIQDLHLEISDGTGTITGTALGFGADRDDPAKWEALPTTEIVVAEFSGVDVTEHGFSHTPNYRGVTFPSISAEQVTTGDDWGAFPESFIDFNRLTGQAPYWYSSGGAADAKKPANPFAVTIGEGEWRHPLPAGEPSPAPKPEPGDDNPEPPGQPDSSTAPQPTDDFPAPEESTSGATFFWGINEETSSSAYFGGCNFLSAGVAPNTGSSRVWTGEEFSSSSGNVSVVKASDSGWVPVTWDNKCLDRNGTRVSTSGHGSNTESQVVISDGAIVQHDAGGVRIEWSGSFSVVYYGGLTYWTASDPVLQLDADGNGSITATGSGYGASMSDTAQWVPLEAREITLANLTGVDLESISAAGGFSHTPDYLGVSYSGEGTTQGSPDGTTTSASQTPRTETNAAYWGSFPADFIEFQKETGQFSYWFTSGGARDQYKPTLPVTVSFAESFVPDVGTYEASGAPTLGNSPGGQVPAPAPGSAGSPSGSQHNGTSLETAKNTTATDASAGSTPPVATEAPKVTPTLLVGGGSALLAVAAANWAGVLLFRRKLGLDPASFS